MGVRPPQREDGSPDVIEFGIAALDARLDDAGPSFPATSQELVRQLGNPEISYDAHGNSIALSTALEQVERDEFDSKQQLLNVLHPVFESYRRNTSTGIVASIRSFLPF